MLMTYVTAACFH